MITENIYKNILDVIKGEIPLPDNWLLGRKTEDATDARCFLCHYLSVNGLSSLQIQSLTGLKKSTVNKGIHEFAERIYRRNITLNWKLHIDHELQAKGLAI